MASSYSSQAVQRSDEAHLVAPELSPDSSSTSHTRLTPDYDSDHSQDLAIDEEGMGEGYLMRHISGEGREKVWDAEGSGDESDDRAEEGQRRASVSTTQSYQLYTPDEERKVVGIFDRKLVLFVALLYMLSFLDRSSMLSMCIS